MPSSTYRIINQTVEQMLLARPKSILDIGVGFGKYGFLAREYMETWNDRVFPEQWVTRIDGIEIFEPYTKLPHNQEIYDTIYLGDAHKIICGTDEQPGGIDSYDLIMAMDVVEHLDKDRGVELVKNIIAKANKTALINVPTGNWLGNKVVAENEHEAHQAIWNVEDLALISQEMKVNAFVPVHWAQGSRGGCLGIFYNV